MLGAGEELTVIILELDATGSRGRLGELFTFLAEQLFQLLDVVDCSSQSLHFTALALQVRDVHLEVAEAVVDSPDSGPLPEVPLHHAGRLVLLDAVVMLDERRSIVLEPGAVSTGGHFAACSSLDLPSSRLLLTVVLTQRPHGQRLGLVRQTHCDWD